MRQALLDLYAATRAYHVAAYNTLATTKLIPDMGELADTAYALSETEKFLEDALKETRRLRRNVDGLACALWMQDSTNAGEPIRTEWVTATPDLKLAVKVPKQRDNPELFAKFMTDLGVPEHLWKGEVVRAHWPGLCDYVSELVSQGKPLPGGISPDSTVPEYRLKLRKRKLLGPTDDEETTNVD